MGYLPRFSSVLSCLLVVVFLPPRSPGVGDFAIFTRFLYLSHPRMFFVRFASVLVEWSVLMLLLFFSVFSFSSVPVGCAGSSYESMAALLLW